MAHVVDDVLAREQVLRRLVLEYASLGFVYGSLGQDTVVVQTGDGTLRHDVVDLFLIETGEFLQSLLGIGYERIYFIDDALVYFLFSHLFSSVLPE